MLLLAPFGRSAAIISLKSLFFYSRLCYTPLWLPCSRGSNSRARCSDGGEWVKSYAEETKAKNPGENGARAGERRIPKCPFIGRLWHSLLTLEHWWRWWGMGCMGEEKHLLLSNHADIETIITAIEHFLHVESFPDERNLLEESRLRQGRFRDLGKAWFFNSLHK